MNSLKNQDGPTSRNTRTGWIVGLATLGLALSAPVQAAPNFVEGGFIVAKRDRGDEVRSDPRETRNEERRAPKREAEQQEEPQGYGYGYERRRQQQDEQEDRSRGRR